MTTQAFLVDLHPYLALAAFLTHTSPVRAAAMLDSMSNEAQYASLAALSTASLWPEVAALTRAMSAPEAEASTLHGEALVTHAACILEHRHTDAVNEVRGMAVSWPAQANELLRRLATLDMLWEQEDACVAPILSALPPPRLALVLLAEDEPLRQRILALCGERREAVEQGLRDAAKYPFTELEVSILLPCARQQLLLALRTMGVPLRWQGHRIFNPRYNPCPSPQGEKLIAESLSDEDLLLRLRGIPAGSLALVVYSLGAEARQRLLSLCSPRMQKMLEQDMADFPRITAGMVAEAWTQWEAAEGGVHVPSVEDMLSAL